MAGRVVSIALVATDRMSRAFRTAGDSADRLSGQLDNINKRGGDLSGAVSGLVSAGRAIAAIPSAAPIAAGIGALAPAFLAAGAGAGALAAVAIPAINRIKTALDAQSAAEKGAGAAAASAAAAQNARISAQNALASAIRNAATQHAQALEQVRRAEESVADAQKDAKQAQLDLIEARETAQQQALDLDNRLTQTQLNVKSGILDVSDAQDEYNKLLADPKATQSQIDRAKLAIEQAKQNLKEQRELLKRLQKEQKEADKAGVEGSEVVKDARDQLAEANKKLEDSERELAEAKKNVAQVDRESAEQIEAARRALNQANMAGVGSTNELADAMADLSPAARTLMGQWQGLTSTFDVWQRSMEPTVLPLFGRGIELLKAEIPSLTPIVKGAAGAVDNLLDSVEKGADSPGWATFKDQMTALVPVSLEGFGKAVGNIAVGLMGIVQAFVPHAPAMIGAVESLTAGFARWGTGLANSPGFARFQQWVQGMTDQLRNNGPLIRETLAAVASAFINIGSALTPIAGSLGTGVFTSIGLIAQAVNLMSPGQIQALAWAFLAYRSALVVANLAQIAFAGGAKAMLALSALNAVASQFAAGFANVNLAFRDGATRATLLGAAIKSQLLAWRQQTAAALASARATALAAAAAVRARLAAIAQATAQRLAAGAARAWAAAQWLLNAAMAGNPIVLIVLAIVALVAALVLAYQKSETFRAIVQAVWAGIKNAISVAWDFIKGVFSAIWGWITGTLVPVFQQIGTVVQAVWQRGVVPAVQMAWGILKAIFSAIWNVVKNVLMVAWIVLSNAFKIAWIAIQIVIKVAWAILKGIFKAIAWFVSDVLAPVFQWLYDKVIKPVWGAIRRAISTAWNDYIKPIFRAVWRFLSDTLGPVFSWLYEKVIKPVWGKIKSVISTVWNDGIKPAFTAIKNAVGKVKDAFGTAVDGIGKVWDGLKNIAKKPVNFVIGLYNKGIVSLVNKIADFAGIKTRLNPIPTFATGGVMPGYAPGRDTLMAAVSPGEAILRPEFTRGVGAGWITKANAIARHSGEKGVRRWLGGGGDKLGAEGIGYSRGGTVPGYAGAFGLGGIVNGFVKGLKDFTFGNVDKAAEKVLNKIIGDGIPGSGVLNTVLNGIPLKIKDGVLGWIKKKIGGAAGGPGMRGAYNWARTQAGKPYIWGGVGPAGYDCSGFMSAITNVIQGRSPYARMFTTHSFNGETGPGGFVRNLQSPFKVGVNSSHMAGTILGTNVESSSGIGVRFGGGARGFNDPLFPAWYGLKADTGHLALSPGWNPPTFNGTGRTELLSVDAERGDGEFHFHNHGVIGSQAEVDKWLGTSLERLRRRRKLPGMG